MTNDCPNLIALAVLLLEIRSGEPIEQIQNREQPKSQPLDKDHIDFQTVHQWYMVEKPRLSAGFSTAILTCLQEFLNPDANLNDPEYSNIIKEKVLQPLENEMQFLVFGPPA